MNGQLSRHQSRHIKVLTALKRPGGSGTPLSVPLEGNGADREAEPWELDRARSRCDCRMGISRVLESGEHGGGGLNDERESYRQPCRPSDDELGKISKTPWNPVIRRKGDKLTIGRCRCGHVR